MAKSFIICLAFAFLTVHVAAAEPPAQKLNVLFIAADDWRPEIGCYGVAGIKTPNVDKFATSAVRFKRAYCQFPLCNPSRTSFLTGRYPTTTGVLDNTTAFRDKHPDWISLPEHFKNQGYFVARTGKIYHGGIDDPKAWNEVLDGNPAGTAKTSPTKAKAANKKNEAKKARDPSLSDRVVMLEGDGESHVDYHTAVRGIELLEKHQDEPFFIAVGFLKPHSPPTAPKKFFDLYEPAGIDLPTDFQPRPTVPAGFPEASIPQRNGDLFVGRDATPEAARDMIRAYRASASWTDWNIGRVLDALERLKLADKTVVVFLGDHGYHLGEKGKWSKHGSLFEVGTHVPLIVRVPDVAGNGKVSSRTVELVDLYPTLAELCGLTVPDGLEGQSFVSLLKDPHATWDHPAFSVARNRNALGQTVRTERWRYTQWDGGQAGAVLFDHATDPHEMDNLVTDPAHAATVAELKSLLTKQFSSAAQ